MERRVYTGIRMLYSSSRDHSNEIRLRIRMRDQIDPLVLRKAVDAAMKRYPYFCVELRKVDNQYVFTDNSRPVVISNSLHGTELNAK